MDGIGIGLYLAHEIVTVQGGYIKVKSEVGCGATFSVFLRSENNIWNVIGLWHFRANHSVCRDISVKIAFYDKAINRKGGIHYEHFTNNWLKKQYGAAPNITKSLDRVAQLADRIIRIEDGKISE